MRVLTARRLISMSLRKLSSSKDNILTKMTGKCGVNVKNIFVLGESIAILQVTIYFFVLENYISSRVMLSASSFHKPKRITNIRVSSPQNPQRKENPYRIEEDDMKPPFQCQLQSLHRRSQFQVSSTYKCTGFSVSRLSHPVNHSGRKFISLTIP